MSFTKEAITVHGGCNCKAIRYEVSVPPYSERPPTPYRSPGSDVGDLRIPSVYLCHCNDCRLATSAISPIGLVNELKTVKVSLVPRSSITEGAFSPAASDRTWISGTEAFDFHNPPLETTYLSRYKSSPHASRWFCGRCGTPVAYSVDPKIIPAEWKWPMMLDIWLSTVDRDDLDHDYMVPERMLWCRMGVPWIRKFTREGLGNVPEHPLTKIDKVVGDDIEDDLKELAALGEQTKAV